MVVFSACLLSLLQFGCQLKNIGTIDKSVLSENEESTFDSSWQELYYDVLTEFKSSDSYYPDSNDYVGGSMFDLFDMDEDDIPELIISESLAHAHCCRIYTVKSDELISLGNYGSFGSVMYCPQKGVLLSYYIGQGYESGVYLKLDGKEFIEQMSFTSDEGAVGEENAEYTINDEQVSKEEFKLACKEYDDNNSFSLGRSYYFEEETLNSLADCF